LRGGSITQAPNGAFLFRDNKKQNNKLEKEKMAPRVKTLGDYVGKVIRVASAANRMGCGHRGELWLALDGTYRLRAVNDYPQMPTPFNDDDVAWWDPFQETDGTKTIRVQLA
jgi:hypothetical protein